MTRGRNAMWIIYALLSAVFAALTTILAKIGVENVDSTLCYCYPNRRGARDGMGHGPSCWENRAA